MQLSLPKLALWVLLTSFVSSAFAAQPPTAPSPNPRRILIVFSEGKDLPGNVMLEQALKAKLQTQTTNEDEFYTEHMDSSHFSDEAHYRIFRDYLAAKYASAKLDLVIVAMARDYILVEKLPADVFGTIPTIFLTASELDVPAVIRKPNIYGVVQRLDVDGALRLIPQLRPDTRKLVVIGGKSLSDTRTLDRIRTASKQLPGMEFDYWTDYTLDELPEQIARLDDDTAVLISTMFQDASGQTVYMTRAAQFLAPASKVPIYVFAIGAVGSGAVGGAVIDPQNLASQIAQLALLTRDTKRKSPLIRVSTNSMCVVDWRALERWHIDPARLPPHTEIRYRPVTLWEQHRLLISLTALVIVAQALTIAALIAQHARRKRAEAELVLQRSELAHVSRVSTMGQLASALAHEINQPLGAILRNTEAAEIFLKSDSPDLPELRAILADIRKDDQRAGEVIDRMRSLLKRRNLELTALDLNELVADTLELTRPDAQLRHVQFDFQTKVADARVRADRVHLQQVLLNLIINGMDAMNACANGERVLSVTVRTATDHSVEIAICDQGSGIPQDKLTRVFEPFYTTKPEGMGMGLAISRTIIEAHGGKIRAANNSSKGATISCTLPLARN